MVPRMGCNLRLASTRKPGSDRSRDPESDHDDHAHYGNDELASGLPTIDRVPPVMVAIGRYRLLKNLMTANAMTPAIKIRIAISIGPGNSQPPASGYRLVDLTQADRLVQGDQSIRDPGNFCRVSRQDHCRAKVIAGSSYEPSNRSGGCHARVQYQSGDEHREVRPLVQVGDPCVCGTIRTESAPTIKPAARFQPTPPAGRPDGEG